jgi:hypothetical protein
MSIHHAHARRRDWGENVPGEHVFSKYKLPWRSFRTLESLEAIAALS